MAVTLTGAGGLFTWLGPFGGRKNDLAALRGGTATTRVTSSASLDTFRNNALSSWATAAVLNELGTFAADLDAFKISGCSAYMRKLQATARTMLIRQVHNDNPQPGGPDGPNALYYYMKELVRQISAASGSVNASQPSAGSQSSVGSPTGTPNIVVSVKTANGKSAEYAVAEDIKFLCVSDGYQQSNISAGQELFAVSGEAAATDLFQQDWPRGSGALISVYAVDGDVSYGGTGQSLNLLQNSGFETFTTANQPDNWTRLVGTVGTTIINGSAQPYTGTGALAFVGDGGGTLSSVYQAFNVAPTTTLDAGGTSAILRGRTQYAVSLWVRVSSTPAAGVLTVDLVDSTPTVYADDAGTSNTFTIDLTAVSTTYLKFSGIFRTPSTLLSSSTVRLRIRLSTAITNTHTVYIDKVAMTPMIPLYQNGPSVAIFSGATKLVKDDQYQVAISNTWGEFQKMFQQFFDMRTLDLQLPSDNAGAETIVDTLVA